MQHGTNELRPLYSGVPMFAGGFIGVDVFFVLSGFLITRLLLRERQATGRIAFSSFYARRLRRLLPALAVMLIETGGLALPALKPDAIIIGSSAGCDFSETEWIAGSERVFERLAAVAPAVFVISGTPALGFNGRGCIARYASRLELVIDRCKSKSKKGVETAEHVASYLQRAAKHLSRVHVINLNDLVCPGGICYALTRSGEIVFRDSQHLNDSFVRAHVPEIREAFEAARTAPDQSVVNSAVRSERTP